MEYSYRQNSKDIVTQHLINRASTRVTAEQIELVNVEATVSKYGNTKATFEAVEGKGRTGTFDFFYNRMNVADVVVGLVLTVPYKEYKNSYEVLYELNSRYGFALEEYEIERTTYGTQGAYTLVMSAASPVWYGSIMLYREAASDSLVRAFDIVPTITTTSLIESIVKSKITGEVLYEPYNFTSIKDRLSKLVDGVGQDQVVLKLLNELVEDPWVIDATTTAWNLKGCRIKHSTDAPWSVVEIHMGTLCANVNGHIRLKYVH